MKYNFVYKTTNNLNGDYYYGVHSTNNLDDGYMGSGLRITRAIKCYGKENFTREVVQYFSNVKNAYILEKAIVTPELINDPHCYNISVGGKGGNLIGTFNEQELKEFGQKISKANKGRKASEETKKKMSTAQKGRFVSDETRMKISEANKGRKASEETKRKLSESHKGNSPGNKGVPMSDEQKKYLSEKLKGRKNPKTAEKLKGRKLSVEHKLAIKNSLKDIVQSKEYKEKMSNSLKGMIFINNGIINKRVKDTEKDIFLNNGWQLGRIKINK